MTKNEKLLQEVENLTKEDRQKIFDLGVRNSNQSIIKIAILTGVDVTANIDYVMRLASEKGYAEIVKMLIEAGADATADDNYAIKKASKNGHIEVVKLLIEAGSISKVSRSMIADIIKESTGYDNTEIIELIFDTLSK